MTKQELKEYIQELQWEVDYGKIDPRDAFDKLKLTIEMFEHLEDLN